LKKLKVANQPRSAFIGVTGHTNERSVADYEEGDENHEQRLISSINQPINSTNAVLFRMLAFPLLWKTR